MFDPIQRDSFTNTCAWTRFPISGHDMFDDQSPPKTCSTVTGANWEDFFCNLQLAETEVVGKRWLITSVYKQGLAN